MKKEKKNGFMSISSHVAMYYFPNQEEIVHDTWTAPRFTVHKSYQNHETKIPTKNNKNKTTTKQILSNHSMVTSLRWIVKIVYPNQLNIPQWSQLMNRRMEEKRKSNRSKEGKHIMRKLTQRAKWTTTATTKKSWRSVERQKCNERYLWPA